MSKVSDFRFVTSIIKSICRSRNTPFIDMNIEFGGEENKNSNYIQVEHYNNLLNTMLGILSTYIENYPRFYDKNLFANKKQEIAFLSHCTIMLRRFQDGSGALDDDMFSGVSCGRLYQNMLVWTLMKNIVCPVNNVPIKNVLMVYGKSPKIDVSKFYSESDRQSSNLPDDEFIFVNYDIKNSIMRNVSIFIETLVAHGLEPSTSVKKILESPVYDKFTGAVNLAYSDEKDKNEFMTLLLKILSIDYEEIPHIKKIADRSKNMSKTAQWWDSRGNTGNPMWWYFGLHEKMLEPVRGYDWSVRETLQKFIDEFWDQVDDIEKKKKQGDRIPFDLLLRLKQQQTVDGKTDVRKTLQELLSSQRISD